MVQKKKSKKNAAVFGSSLPRFGRITVHPNLDPSGLYSARPDGCDPCRYHPQPLHKIFEVNKRRTNINKDPWRYKKELEEWAQNLGYRNQSVLASRRYQNSVLGPAWHYVDWPAKYEPACMNVGFGRTSRFRPTKNNLPGPGTYYNAHPFKAPYGPHSTRPTFEREEPCRFKDTSPKWSLASNRYTIIDKESIEQKSKKVVSLRGPYDLFTGKRDGSTIKNHFSSSGRVSSSTWPIALKGSLLKYKKSHFGEMNKTSRDLPCRSRITLTDLAMSLRKPSDPGPAHYGIGVEPKEFKPNKRPFNSTYDKGPGYQRVIVWPGVGRYSPTDGRTCGLPGHGHRHVFRSKVPRETLKIPPPMNSF